ncbi:MAG: hypothetical protein Q9220_000265 [cf. Caloplaca sp. 1 TL-2023]
MARQRHKKRTHIGARNGPTSNVPANVPGNMGPKSMVIRVGAGKVGSSVSQLVKDVRSMMEPGTASRLKERKSNKLKDYTTMAGPLGISHLLLFSRSSTGNTNLRLAVAPRGPTLHFRVEKYALCKDVRKALRHPKGGEKEYMSPPLLVMNNFVAPEGYNSNSASVPKHLETLSTTIFQSLFPPISPQNTPLSSIRRVLLLDRELPKPMSTTDSDDESPYIINLRHFAIVTKPTGLSKSVRRINATERMLKAHTLRKRIPNLGGLEDVADYILDPSAAGSGFTSGSESELETDAEVEVLNTNQRRVLTKKQFEAQKSQGQRPREGTETQKRAVRLVELGPRLTLRMTKVEEGLCGGKVMWHEYLSKSEDEIREMERNWDTRRREKAERKRVQKENVERKRQSKLPGEEKPDGIERDVADEDDGYDSDKWNSEVSDL